MNEKKMQEVMDLADWKTAEVHAIEVEPNANGSYKLTNYALAKGENASTKDAKSLAVDFKTVSGLTHDDLTDILDNKYTVVNTKNGQDVLRAVHHKIYV